jgi:phosphoglycerate dehydrogenase-like enzyme
MSSSRVVVVCMDSPHSFWRLSERHERILATTFSTVTFRVITGPDLVADHLLDAEVYFGWRFRPDWFSLAPRLAWVSSPAAGFDHLPVAEADAAGVAVTRSYGFHGRPMAEHAMGLVLGFSRGLFTSSRYQQTRRWWKDDLAAEFFDLADATMTIVGCGSVGGHLAHAALAFGMNVIGVRRNPLTSPTSNTSGITWLPSTAVHEALTSADVVVDLLPASDDTQDFFNAATFAAFKPGSVFLNLGRPSTVDQTALLDALNASHLRGAALDITDPRPLAMDHPLRRHPRVVLTPKSAVFSRIYMDNAVDFFADNLRRYLAGRPLNGLVTTHTASHPTTTAGG